LLWTSFEVEGRKSALPMAVAGQKRKHVETISSLFMLEINHFQFVRVSRKD
jgi:hypothetical protein